VSRRRARLVVQPAACRGLRVAQVMWWRCCQAPVTCMHLSFWLRRAALWLRGDTWLSHGTTGEGRLGQTWGCMRPLASARGVPGGGHWLQHVAFC
jgi:hypothetical protein